eukprot:Plantae.Rhodophyta-Hildenbrandia_rubra.ctg21749.p1 GENE.Plantae.Rhodophyta-Hildenbrandia_rubra.ctg21749~~Plantae.Rhodophyta-Hildenbrandia_rubra.ctg21749.p1  ORF type:complete len:578 (-),score=85.56 Plantae.Rhodophyta-Hildenbrandia_rubra.ctg21749:1126-2859(-)
MTGITNNNLMDDAFRLLCGGTLGHSTRKALSTKASTHSTASPVTIHTAADLPSTLDFFGGKKRAQTSRKQTAKSNKRQATDDAEGEGGQGEGYANGKRKKRKKRVTSQELELAAAERRKCGVKVRPSQAAEAPRLAGGIEDIGHLGLEKCLKAVFGFQQLTPVQKQVLPAMQNGLDVVAVAPTGSGKTLAYLIPMVKLCLEDGKSKDGGIVGPRQRRRNKKKDIRGVVLVPTRELTVQVTSVLRRIVEGSDIKWSEKWIWIGTPARLVKETSEGMDVACVRCIVLDEADKLIESAYQEAVDRVLADVGAQREALRRSMFSATLPYQVSKLADELLRDPLHVSVKHKSTTKADRERADNEDIEDDGSGNEKDLTKNTLEHRFMFAGGKGELGKIHAMRQLLTDGVEIPMLVFVRERDRASELMKELIYLGVSAEMLHSGVLGKARANTLKRFRAGEIAILVATDLLARGVDLIGVKTVVSYDCPTSAGEYVHRAGRTARGGRKGLSVVLFTELDSDVLPEIARQAERMGALIPKWMKEKRRRRTNRRSKNGNTGIMKNDGVPRKRTGGAPTPKREIKA